MWLAGGAEFHTLVLGHRSYLWNLEPEGRGNCESENVPQIDKNPRGFELSWEIERDLKPILFRSLGGRKVKSWLVRIGRSRGEWRILGEKWWWLGPGIRRNLNTFTDLRLDWLWCWFCTNTLIIIIISTINIYRKDSRWADINRTGVRVMCHDSVTWMSL